MSKWIDFKFLVFCLPIFVTACGEGTRISSRLDALVNRADPYAPYIDLTGGAQVQSEVLEAFRDPGFTAGSLFDGDLTSRVVVNNKVNSNVLGQYTVTYTVEDSKGREASAIRRVSVSDSHPPQITLVGANPLMLERSQNFIEPGFTVTDSYDRAPIFSSTQNVNSDLVGSYEVEYFANDASGNEARLVREVRVRDTIIPVVTITQPLVGSGFFSTLNVRGTCEVHSQTSAVRISGDVLNSPVETPCQTGGVYDVSVTLSMGEADKIIRASQTDGGGNSGEDLKIVRRGKALAILFPAANTATTGSVSVTGQCTSGFGVTMVSFSSTNNGIIPRAPVLCVEDAFSASIQLSPGTGSRNVTVQQTDAAGVMLQDSRDFRIDSEVPNIFITAPAVGAAFHGSFTLQGSCESQAGAQPVIITGAIMNSPMSVTCVNSLFSRQVTFTGTPDTSLKTINVSQLDELGNPGSDLREFQHGLGLAITAPAVDTPNNGTTQLTVIGSCSSAPGVVSQITFGGNIQSSSPGTCVPSGPGSRFGTFSGQVTLSGGSQGVRPVTAQQIDAAAINGASAPRQFQLDTQAPAVTVLTPAEGLRTRLRDQTISGVCESSVGGLFPAEALEVTGDIENQPLAVVCTGGSYSQQISLTTGDGNKVIRVRQRDFAGNFSAQINRNVVLDTTPPNLAFVAPLEGAFFQNSITIGGTCEWNDGGTARLVSLEILRNGSVVGSPLTTFCLQGGSSNNTFVFNNVNLSGPDGGRTLRVRRSDLADNERIITRNIYKDSTPPEIILNPDVPSGGFHARDICDSTLDLVATPTDNLDPSPQLQTQNPTIFYVRGDYTIQYTATDAAGNVGNRSVLVKVRRIEATYDFDRGVYDRASLDGIRNNLSQKYFLCQDINLQNVAMESIGGNNQNSGLTGVLYGGTHSSQNRPFKIQGFQNTGTSNASTEGLFDRIETSGVVEHLILEGFQVGAQNEVGALAGLNNGRIKRVGVTGAAISRTGSSSSRESFGGLAGINRNQIEKSYVENSHISGLENVGGLVGTNSSGSGGSGGGSGTIIDSFVSADVTVNGEDKVGGLIGVLEGVTAPSRISNTYSLAEFSSTGLLNTRPLIGLNDAGETVSSSYYDIADDLGDPVEAYGTPLSAAAFTARLSFVGWDFSNIWNIDEGVSVPRLQGLP